MTQQVFLHKNHVGVVFVFVVVCWRLSFVLQCYLSESSSFRAWKGCFMTVVHLCIFTSNWYMDKDYHRLLINIQVAA